MRRLSIFLIALLAILLTSSCRSTKSMTETVEKDSLVQTSNLQVGASVITDSNTEEEDSMEVFTVTIITEYDTAKADSAGNSPVARQTKVLQTKRKGSKKGKETTTKQNISATKEESANQVKQSNNKRESTVAETKQPLYYAYILYGVAFVILMAVLAYWVFTKYRAERPH